MADTIPVPRVLWLLQSACLCIVVLGLGHLQLTTLADTIGFSSNRDFYYETLHPIRAMIRLVLLVVGLVGVAVCMVLLARHGRKPVLRATLVISGICAACVLASFLLLAIAMGFALIRGEVGLIELSLTIAFLVPPLLGTMDAIRLFRGMSGPQNLRLSVVTIALLGVQAVFLLQDGMRAFFPTLMVSCAAVTLGIVVWQLARRPFAKHVH